MIFGLFKKEESADIIFTGGRIYTQDPDAPWVSAVACKDGKVMAVGDAETIAELEGDETEIVDLEGGYMLPGFMDSCAHPVLRAFNQVCLVLYDDMSMDEILSALSDHIAQNPEKPSYFAYGFHSDLVAEINKDEAQKLLDGVCSEKPIVMLDVSGFQGWFNTCALEAVREHVAEEQETPMITLAYLLHVLAPVDFEELQSAVVNLAVEYCQRGYTSVFDCGAPDYMHSVYQEILVEMLQEDMLKQRFFGSLLVTKNLDVDYLIKKLMQKRTNCAEVNDYIRCQTLKLILDTESDSKSRLTTDMVKILAIQASDKGFNLHIDAMGKGSVSEAFEAAFYARGAGYKKNHITIAHSYTLSQEEKTELLLDNELTETSSTLGDFTKKYRALDNAKDVTDAINKLTIDAADQMGLSAELGAIEVGKYADFVIFSENPLDCNLPRFRALTAAMTVIGGAVVYDAEEDNAAEWLTLLSSQPF